MSSAGPWSVKGIDPKAREIAKDLARRSGMTLGEWLNQMIIDGGEPEPPPYEPPAFKPQGEAFRRQGPTVGGRDFAARAPAYYDEPDTGDLSRVTRALDALSARLEAAEHRSTLAISGIDQSVMGVLARMDGVERDQTAVGAGLHGALDEVRATQSKIAERLRRMEAEDGPRVEAMKALEASLARVAAQIYEGESRARAGLAEVRQDLSGITRRVDQLDAKVDAKADAPELVDSVVSRVAERLEAAEARTSAAVRALEASFAGLDARLKATETRLDPAAEAEAPERRFERLAAELSDKVEASRAEMADRLRQAADGKLDRMEAALRDLAAHVETAERQSAQAIERMGREVVRVAQSLGQRVATVEHRSAAAVEQMGGEMSRIADAMESRMGRAEAAQAEALERLGGEISKIAERLAERIASSERRSAHAIEEVGEQVARVTDKLGQRNEQVTSELGARIRESEERTARLLQEAQEKLDRRLVEGQRRAAVDAAVAEAEAPPASAAFTDDPFATPADDAGFDDEPPAPAAAPTSFSPASFAPGAYNPTGFSPTHFASNAFENEAEVEDEAPAAAQPAATEAFEDEEPEELTDFVGAPAEDAAEYDEFEQPAIAHETPAEPHFQPEPPPRTSTRDLIEAARAAARQASATEARGRRSRADGPSSFSTPAPPLDEPKRGLQGLWPVKKKKKETGAILRTALLASGTAAALAATAVGSYMLLPNEEDRPAETATTPAAPVSPVQAESAAAEILAPALAGAPLDAAEVAAPAQDAARPVSARPAATRPAAPAASANEGPSPEQLFVAATRQLGSGDNTGMAALRRAADMGHPGAQFYLAKVYETGAYGVKKDPVEARRLTERAAIGGDAKAMHNLGLFYFEGVGGTKNALIAASWFRKAAEAGLQDSQFNLARLYEQGYGVPQNAAEAYKWYLIAGAAGDAESKASAERLKPRLSADTQAAAQRAAAAFRTQSTRLAGR